MLEDTEDRLLYIIHDYVEVYFIFLVALCIKCMLELDYVRMEELFHYLQFPVLVSFVLVNLLDRHLLICFVNDCLEDHAE